MLCQSCGKNNATTHIKKIMSGELTEYYLCSSCAAKLGYTDASGGLALGISDLIGSVLGAPGAKAEAAPRCECCQSTFADIARSGKAGCAQCYETFREQLLPSIQRIHGKTKHVGRVPQAASRRAQEDAEIEQARRELAKAIEEENFEAAVVLRDKIRTMELARQEQ